jgi:hypothetical protein
MISIIISLGKYLSHFFDEYGIDEHRGSFSFKKDLSEDEKSIAVDGMAVYTDLSDFLIALELQTCLHFDLEGNVTRLSKIFSNIRSGEMRANVATLTAILSSYDQVTHDVPIIYSKAPEELVRRFIEYCEDAHFKNLSKEMHNLGLFERALTAVPKINRAVRRLIEGKRSKQLIDFGSRSISVATGVPLPTSALAESFLREKYLPPIIDLRIPASRAYLNFRELNPDREKIFRAKSDIWEV